MHAGRGHVGDDDAAARIGDHAVGTDEVVKVGLTRNGVDHASPEAALGLHLALQAEATLERELAASVHQEIGRGRLDRFFGALGRGCGQDQK